MHQRYHEYSYEYADTNRIRYGITVILSHFEFTLSQLMIIGPSLEPKLSNCSYSIGEQITISFSRRRKSHIDIMHKCKGDSLMLHMHLTAAANQVALSSCVMTTCHMLSKHQHKMKNDALTLLKPSSMPNWNRVSDDDEFDCSVHSRHRGERILNLHPGAKFTRQKWVEGPNISSL